MALDSAPLIYYLEENPVYLPVCDELFTALNEGRARGVSSVLTLTEVLVKPLRDGRTDLVNAYRELLTNTNGITLRPIDAIIGERTARLRAKYDWLRVPDAIQLATALEWRADLMVTNDVRWRRLAEISVIILRDYAAEP